MWGRTGERYGQKLWPLLNLPGEGIEVPKVRFQAFAAVAYGAKGIFWFCWRAGGGWDHEAGKKVPLYLPYISPMYVWLGPRGGQEGAPISPLYLP